MQPATPETVLGEFTNVSLTFHNVDHRFYRQNGKFWLDTPGPEGEQQSFEIKYTFGYYPLQQYLVETGDGHIQALNVAWDGRSEAEGGQRWFHLQPDEKITPDHPFHWARHFQNWNSRCADCHSTNLEKNYDPANHLYETAWSEMNVACEACHGAGSRHIELVRAGELGRGNHGFAVPVAKPMGWQFKPGNPIAEPVGSRSEAEINMCGGCHALRTRLSAQAAGTGFHDSNLLRLLNAETYFADGQVREEAFVAGSFLQSKMYEKGVTCGNCHNPHTGKLLLEGNGVCSQCHVAKVYDVPVHHHHPAGTEGALCANCHMPRRTFMQVDARRDHSFTIPRPDLSETTGAPNSCTSCHQEEGRDNAWAREQLSGWGVAPDHSHWGYLNHRARTGDILVTRSLAEAIEGKALPALTRASLLAHFSNMPSRVSVETAKNQLRDENPLVRRAAVSALRSAPPQLRWHLLSGHLKDESRSVRFRLAEALADVFKQLSSQERQLLVELITEYRQSLTHSADSPATQLAIATLELRLGNLEQAGDAYRQALRIEPNYVPALINLADFYRLRGQEEKSQALYERAINVAPDSGAARHSYGLFLVRQQRHDEALAHLAAAVNQDDAQPRFAFVYAVALESRSETEKAIVVLTAAARRWPNQYDVLMTLIRYLEKVGNIDPIYTHLSALSALAPNSPDVRKLVKKYGRQ